MKATLAKTWRVRDVVGHLLDGDLRKLSACRDGHNLGARPVSSFDDLVDLINGLNEGGLSYARRLSPAVMTDLLEVTGRWVSAFVARLNPDAEAHFSVAWAGEERSPNWMDTGREYTERWHHQMQIREAVGATPLLQRRWLFPLLDLSVRAFPRAYDAVAAETGTAVVFEVETEGDDVWSVVRGESSWSVLRGRAPNAGVTVRADADTAWKLLYNALTPEAGRDRVKIAGNRLLAEPLLTARAVMVRDLR